jgi:hypothetical protein
MCLTLLATAVSLPQNPRESIRYAMVRLIDIAPSPPLAGLERRNYGMTRLVEMSVPWRPGELSQQPT